MPALPKYGQAPDNITALAPDECFVFGSNTKGIHGAGAALFAQNHCGAIRGQGYGIQGKSFAIPTKDENLNTLPLEQIQRYVAGALDAMESRPMYKFLFSAIGTGLAGYKSWDISRLFYVKSDGTLRRELSNVYLPKQFLAHGRIFQGEYVAKLTGWDTDRTTEAYDALKDVLRMQKEFWDVYQHHSPGSTAYALVAAAALKEL